MKKAIIFLFLFTVSILAQHVPTAEPVYGGYVEDIDAIVLSSTTTRVFIATRSPNKMFYADASTGGGMVGITNFNLLPDFDASANLPYIHTIAADEYSHYVFAAMEEAPGLIASDITAGSFYVVDSSRVEAVEAYNGYVFYLKRLGADYYMYYGPISVTGSVVTIDSVLLAGGATWTPRFNIVIKINPKNKHVYVFIPGGPPQIYKSSDAFDSFSSSTTFNLISTTDLTSSGHDYISMGIAPDGRIFTFAYEGNTASYNSWSAYSDADGDPWTITSVLADAGRGEFSIVGDSANYYVYYSRVASMDKGASWQLAIPRHADGAVAGDPNTPSYAFCTTDWGMGLYEFSTNTTTEINDGIQAVQVKALGMDEGKSKAWIASKSGIWYVYDYDKTYPVWSTPIWPQGDSYPYFSAICTVTGDTVYVGNGGGKLYRYEASSGAADDPSHWELLFDAEDDAPYPSWTWTYGTVISSIAIDYSYPGERIFIGLYDSEDWDETSPHNGAVFVGENSGGSWSWYQITSSVIPDGIDVNDLTAVTEGGKTVLYVGAEYTTAFSTTVGGVYRMEENSGGSWTVTKDLYLSASYSIAATILDIAKSPQDTLYVCGTDASISNPTIYKKAIGDTYWTVVPSYGFASSDNIARSITFDPHGTIYVAIDNKIYEHSPSASTWSLYYEYPLGTEINFIYYDDLLVGTGTGLYLHPDQPNGVEASDNKIPENFELFPNYPNPFNPTTTIKYSIAAQKDKINSRLQQVTLTVYNSLGQKVATLINEKQEPGNYSVQFKAGNLPSGIYFYTLRAGNFVATKKMILMK
jgi:hypothetical protein